MASKESEDLKVLYRSWIAALGENPEMPLDELRRMFEHWGDVTAEPGGVDYIEVEAGGVPAMWATPKGAREDRVLLCSHGGGYVTGSMYTHRKVYGHFAKAIGCRALIVHYGRAPENVHPGPVDDMVRAYEWLLRADIRPEHIALTGDSAGGGLAVTTLLRARERGLPLPAASMPLSPWLDMEARRQHVRDECREGRAGQCPDHPGDGEHVPGSRRRSEASAGQSAATPISPACRRCTSRSEATRPCSTTAGPSPPRRGRRGWT